MEELIQEPAPQLHLSPKHCASIAIDCLNTFMSASGALSISRYQAEHCNRPQALVQQELDAVAARMGLLRRALWEAKIPQVQLQDAHVSETIHGRRFHSLEIVRAHEQPDFLRTFPPHALLDRSRRYGSPDQQPIDAIKLPELRQVLIRWFDEQLPSDAKLSPERELVFMKDDFCATPGNPHIRQLFWELRSQRRFQLILFGVCDEICNLRNAMLFLASFFNLIYVTDCTYPLNPAQRALTLDYLQSFNKVEPSGTRRVTLTTSEALIRSLS